MEVDTAEYVGDPNIDEKDPVAIINPDNLDQEADQLQDLPLANDCAFPTSIFSRCLPL
jgi:ubiquitin carboxyl-terminal hydrolase 7